MSFTQHLSDKPESGETGVADANRDGDFSDEKAGDKSEDVHANTGKQLLSGIYDGLKQPVDGARQLMTDHTPDARHANTGIANTIGHFAGSAALFVGGTMAAKRLPVIGKIAEGKLAGVATGGTLGFLAPLPEDASISQRALNGATGAAAMGAMEFGPGAISAIKPLNKLLPAESSFKGDLVRNVGASTLGGAIYTEGTTLATTGNHASLKDMALGTATWAGTAAALQGGAKVLHDRKMAKEVHEQSPWQFRELQTVKADDLIQTNQKLSPGYYETNFKSEGHDRLARIYVPQSARDNAPVVAVMHGLAPKGKWDIARELEFNKLADRDGAVVMYLQGRDGLKPRIGGNSHSWNTGDQNARFGYTKNDPSYSDANYFDDAMKTVKDLVPTADTNKIGLAGFSLGGKMANRIAAERDDVGALASMHGTIDKFDKQAMDAMHRDTPLDALFILGRNDRVLRADGGRSLFTGPLENAALSRPREQADHWASRLGLESAGPFYNTQGPRHLHKRQWEDARGGSTITEIMVDNAGHALHGAPRQHNLTQFFMGKPKPANYFDERQAVWDFMLDSLRAQKH